MSKNKNEIKAKKKPWPTKAVMEQVYAMKLWGNMASEFYSGEGSHDFEIVQPYLEVVVSFLSAFKHPLIVCDLGCGDFNVGKDLVKFTHKYIAIDIVADLISYNKEKFKADNLEFHCLDIAVDDLPSGDCATLRQVLQHLSNSEIKRILPKLTRYKYVILTEHLPEGDFLPNEDIFSGQGIRLKKQSGLNILAPPFNFKVKEEKLLQSIKLDDSKGRIVTTIYTMF